MNNNQTLHNTKTLGHIEGMFDDHYHMVSAAVARGLDKSAAPYMQVEFLADWLNTMSQNRHYTVQYRTRGHFSVQELTVKDGDKALYSITATGPNVKTARHACRRQLYEHIARQASCNTMKRQLATPRMDAGTSNAPPAEQDNTQETAELQRNMDSDVKANVQLTETTAPSVSLVAKVKTTKRRFINELPATLDSMNDRWVRVSTLSWPGASAIGSILATIDMPIAMLQTSRCAPNTLLFDQYAYFKTDTRLKIQLNTSPGMSGMLVAGVMYNATSGTSAGVRVIDAAQVMQMPHVRLNAASSNSGELVVPWVYQLPVNSTRDTLITRGSYYFTLFIGVIAPLRTGTGGASQATLTVFGAFENMEFYGQRNYREAIPRMDMAGAASGLLAQGASKVVGALGAGKLVKQVEGLLGQLDLEDCDRPQNPVEPRTVYVQQNTSMSLGTGTNEVKLLQLLHDNTCPHPKDLVPDDKQFSSAFLKQQWGRINSGLWDTSVAAGETLMSLFHTPMRGYPNNGLWLPTPLGGLGMYYGGYHGDIEYRFTFTVSKFHSGRVGIIYVPDDLPLNPNVTCYYSAIVDVQQQSEYVFTVPYQIPTLYATTKSRHREWDLRLNDADFTAANSIQYPAYGTVAVVVINPLRANPTASPLIDIVVEMRGAENFEYVLPIASLHPSQTTTVPTMRGAVPRADQAVDEDSASSRAEPKMLKDERSKVITRKPKLTPAFPTWFTSINERFEIRDVVKRYNAVFCRRSSSIPGLPRRDCILDAHLSVYYSPLVPYTGGVVEGPVLTPHWVEVAGMTTFGKTLMVAHERVTMSTNKTISFRVPWNSAASLLANGIDPTTRPGSMQAYCNGRVSLVLVLNINDTGTGDHQPATYYMDFDVTAGTLQVRTDTEDDNNGLIDVVSFMHDAFRFFRGDLCYQVDIHPYAVDDGWDFATYISRAFGDTANFYVFQGFPNVRTTPTFTQMLTSSALPATRSNIFPTASVWKRDLTTEGVEPNPGPVVDAFWKLAGETLKWCGKFLGVDDLPSFIEAQLPKLRRVVVVAAASQISYGLAMALVVEYLYNDMAKGVARCASTAQTISNIITPSSPDEQMDRAMYLVEIAALVTNVYNSQSQLQTCMNVVCLLNKFGVVKLAVGKVAELFKSDRSSGVTPRADSGRAASWISLIVGAMFAALGLKQSTAFNSDTFAKVCRNYFKDGLNVKKFLDAHLEIFEDVMNWFKRLLGTERPEDIPTNVVAWMEEVHFYCEQYNNDAVIEDTRIAQRIFKLRDQAHQFDRLFVQTDTKPPPGYYQYKNKLNRMIDTLAQGGTSETVRPTPFSLWMYGEPGIGKSRISDEVLVRMGRQIGVVSNDPVYARTSETPYWNNYRQQPLILFPDFAKNQTSQQYLTEINEYMSLVDCWPFNPSFAELPDKRRIVKAEAVMVCSNFGFPNITNVGQVDPRAFYRRRHLLVNAYIPDSVVEDVARTFGVDIAEDIQGSRVPMANRIPAAWFELRGTFSHLRFDIHKNGLVGDIEHAGLPFDGGLREGEEGPTLPNFCEVAMNELEAFRTREVEHCRRQQHVYGALSPEHWEQNVNSLRRNVYSDARRDRTRPDASQSAGPTPRIECPERSDFRLSCVVDHVIERGFTVGHVEFAPALQAEHVLGCGCAYSGTTRIQYSNLCTYFRNARRRFVDTIDGEPDPRHWDGHIPPGALFKIAPDCVVEWDYYVDSCPHNRHVLGQSYFVEHEGRVRVAVDSNDGVTYLLPNACITNFFKYGRKVGTTQFFPNKVPDLTTFSPTRGVRFCQGERVSKHFVIVGDVLRVAINGSVQAVHDAATQVDLLNQLLTGVYPKGEGQDGFLPHSSYDVAMSYFYYEGRRAGSSVNKTYKVAKRIFQNLISLAHIALTLFMSYELLRALYDFALGSKLVEAAPQAYSPGSNTTQATKNTTVVAPMLNVAQPRNQYNVVTTAIMNNTVTVSSAMGAVEALLLCSTYLVCPLHFIAGKSDFRLTIRDRTFDITGSACTYVEILNEEGARTDMAVVCVPCLPAAKNIVGHLISIKETNTIKSGSSVIYKRPDGNYEHEDVDITPMSEVVNYETGAMTGPIAYAGYQWASENHDYRCGACVVSNARIIAMYTADNRREGMKFSSAITREVIVAALQSLGASKYDMRLHKHASPGDVHTDVPVGPHMIPMATLDEPITYSGKTNLAPSPLTLDVAGPFLRPAEQRGDHPLPGVGVVAAAAAKQIKPPDIPNQTHQAVKLFFINMLMSCTSNLINMRRPFTFVEAVCGLPGDIRFPSMNLNTALGWPFKNLVGRGWKKKNVLSLDPPVVHPKLVEHYQMNHALREQGVMPDVAFMDFPKDETLKPNKDTRLINASPIDLFIEMRRYLGQFFISMRGKRTGIAIGMDVHSPAWAEWMVDVPDPIDEDYSNFGPTIHPQVVRAIKELAMVWCEEHLCYGETDLTIVNTIMEEVCCSTHVLGDLKYQILCSSPSGAYGTDVINSLANIYYQMYDHYITFGDFDRWDAERMIVYGDDLRRNRVRSHEQHKTNLESIGKVITEDKAGRAFLKRKVNILTCGANTYVLAPLPPHVVVDVLHWLRKPYFSATEAMQQRIEGFLNEVAHYGPSTYAYTKRTLSELGHEVPEMTHEQWLAEHYPEQAENVAELRNLDCGYSQKNLGPLFFDVRYDALNKDEYNELFELAIHGEGNPLGTGTDLLDKGSSAGASLLG